MWEKKVLDYTIEDMLLFSEIVFGPEQNQPLDITPLFNVEIGSTATIIFNGETYTTTITEMPGGRKQINFTVNNNGGVVRIVFGEPGTSMLIVHTTGKSGTISSISARAKNYQKIDSNYIPSPSVYGTGYNSINLTNNYGVAEGVYSVVSQNGQAKGLNSFSANNGKANNDYTFANGFSTQANGMYSHAEGFNTIASGKNQHAEGTFNIEDTEEKYAHIVGNGHWDDESNAAIRSNAHTLDWSGNAWFAGSVEGTSIILSSPNGSRFNVTVNDDGQL